MPSVRGRFDASGPILDVYVGVCRPRELAKAAAGQTVNPPLRLQLIIDTGAGMTLINEQHMRSLDIPVSGETKLLTAVSDAGATACNTYDVAMRIGPPDQDGFVLPIVEVVGRPFFHGVDGLIGRDILRHLTFTSIGRESRFILEWP